LPHLHRLQRLLREELAADISPETLALVSTLLK
jgi:hypothetical protein